MLGTLRSRRQAAVACALATLVGRSAPAQLVPPGEGAGPASLVSDCDFSVSGCGKLGGELYGGSSNPEPGWINGGMGTPTNICGSGWKVQCRSLSAETCAQWVIVEGGGRITFSPTSAGVGGNITQVCGSYVTNTLFFYVYS